MAKEPIEIRYRFTHAGDPAMAIGFTVRLDPDTLEHMSPGTEAPPEWTRLEAEQCSHCPLDPAQHTHCPIALSVVELVEAFNPLLSFSEFEVTVETPERTITRRTSIQKALSSLLGLYMATSGCPNMGLLKPMARFHLPFATKEETIFRAASSYLLGQYLLRQRGLSCDLEMNGLYEAYQRIHKVNMGMAKRLRRIARGDANINAIVLLDLFAHEMPSAIDLKMRDLEYLFRAYFEEAAAEGVRVPQGQDS
ncbi:MAG: hypothetical protein HYV26_03015 [Candidatus Hydrogenedentes bacterium]|nr:hypothetical protein [Candidatus Hydrogenedentota bacterium]